MIRDELACFASSLTFESIPLAVTTQVKRLLIDHVSSMLAGPRAFAAELPDLPALVSARGGVAESTVIGASGRYPCASATFSNTALGFTGIDAWHQESTIHVPVVLFPAAIAVGERQRANGRQLIEAIVAGAEVMIRIGEALGSKNVYGRGFHPTSICGPFGCAVAAAKLLNLSAAQMAEAISTAAVQSAGSSIWAGSRTPATFCVQIGRAAENGVLAAQLAASGCYGVDRIFEDPRGFEHAYAGAADSAKYTAGLASHFRITGLMMQQFWFGPYLLTSIESLLVLLGEHDIAADDIEAMNVRIPTTVLPLIGAVEYPQNRLATVTTLRYALSVISHLREAALYTAAVSSAEMMADRSVQALFTRITVVGDDELDRNFPGTESSILVVRTRTGQTFTRRHDGPVRGDPDNPLSDEELVAKFEVMAAPALRDSSRAAVLESIAHLEELEDINELTALWTQGQDKVNG